MIILKGCKITMNRLTESNPSWIDDELWESACEPDCEEIDAVYRKLKDYEDLEENGNLLRLPYKLGDTVYGIFRGKRIVPLKVRSINLTRNEIEMCLENKDYLNYGTITVNVNSKCSVFDKNNFGIEWYKTYEEAEESVKEALLDRDTDGIER